MVSAETTVGLFSETTPKGGGAWCLFGIWCLVLGVLFFTFVFDLPIIFFSFG
jgi:hypothetical protein